MSINSVREELQRKLENIDGISSAYAYPPEVIESFPAAIVDWDRVAAEYNRPGNSTLWRFRILLLIEMGHADAEDSFRTMDEFIEKTGNKSIKKNLETNDAGDWTYVTEVNNLGAFSFERFPGQVFYGCEFVVEVGDTT